MSQNKTDFEVEDCLNALGRNPDTVSIEVPLAPTFSWPNWFRGSTFETPTSGEEFESLRIPELENMNAVDEWWLMVLKQSRSFFGFEQIEVMYASSAVLLQSLYRYYGESRIYSGTSYVLAAVTRLFSDEDYRARYVEVLQEHNAFTAKTTTGTFTDCCHDFRYGSPEIAWIEHRTLRFDALHQLAIDLAERFDGELTPDQLAVGLLEGQDIALWLVQVAEPNGNDFQDLMGDTQSSIEWLIAGLCRHRDLAAYNIRHLMAAIMAEIAHSDEVSDILFMGTGWHEIQAQAEVFNSAYARPSSIAYICSRSMSVSWVSDVEFSQE